MKSAILTLSLLGAASAFAAAPEETIGMAGCLVINPHPIAKETIKWNGPCKDGYANGEGDLEWFVNGDFGSYYKGALEGGRMHGSGYWKDRSGMEYQGAFQHGKREGKGAMLFPDGDHYEGEWKAGAPDGAGVMVYALGGRYEGQWRGGLYQGKGKAMYAGGQVVEGEFAKGEAVGSKPRDMPKLIRSYSLQSDEKWDTYFKADLVTGSAVPYEKSYADMSRDEKLIVNRSYRLLFDGDEPPYPLHGTKEVDLWLNKVLAKVQTTGILRLDVLVDRDGNAESVTFHATPRPDINKLVSEILMAQKFKPALCSGKPCAMAFPIERRFVLK